MMWNNYEAMYGQSVMQQLQSMPFSIASHVNKKLQIAIKYDF